MKKVVIINFRKSLNGKWYYCDIRFSYSRPDYTHLKEDGLSLLLRILKLNIVKKTPLRLLPLYLTDQIFNDDYEKL